MFCLWAAATGIMDEIRGNDLSDHRIGYHVIAHVTAQETCL